MFFIFQLGRLQTVQFVYTVQHEPTNKLGYNMKFAVVQITELKCKLNTAYDAHDNAKK